ncbi:MAG: MBL fold metallo-hydrolase [Proteobacteria bacterium]|nr:MAG: MBL fold metallo-hydrolase [Pseudomonadota bacterium]
MKNELLLRQLFDPESSTYTYLYADAGTREAILIDPVIEQAARDQGLLKELNLNLKYILETHVHADHITGAHELRKLTGAKIVVGKDSGAVGADTYIGDGEELKVGTQTLTALATPGHTKGCMSYAGAGLVFTGDALMIKDVGRTDFQGGSTDRLYQSITEKLFALPPATIIYPAHDYEGRKSSSVAEEIAANKKLGGGVSLAEFCERVAATKLAQPKKIHIAVPANLRCGEPSA